LFVKTVLSDQGIYHRYAGEAAEVAVRRPKFAHAVLPAQGHDTRVMNSGTYYGTLNQKRTQSTPMSRRFGQQS
jgi:hypothetical protein